MINHPKGETLNLKLYLTPKPINPSAKTIHPINPRTLIAQACVISMQPFGFRVQGSSRGLSWTTVDGQNPA